jgi:alkylhydroperoxidase/carboxymuconolactone decarboxylase family protein YurZ
VEIILHLMGYVGVPMARKALIVTRDVFAAVRAEEQAAQLAASS